MTARYTVSRVGDTRTVTAYVDGQMLVTNDQNPNFEKIVERLFENKTDNIADLFTAERLVARKFKNLSERVAVSDGVVYFDGDPIEGVLADHLMRLIHDGEDVTDLVAFWENIAGNPTEHSRENLLRWLTASDFSITREGMIVGYKGLRSDRTSVHAGPAIVDGVEVNGHVPNNEGSVVAMARSAVEHDPGAACSYGLHVGTWDYASRFGQMVVEVLVNPRDVVSVPTDCDGQKMRVCRYTVGRKVTDQRSESVVDDYDNDFVEYASSDWEVL
jgi:hypothetical protein